MMEITDSYNSRLFESGALRAYFHNSRFNWFVNVQKRLNIPIGIVFELGCFDGRLLDYLVFEPKQYYGLDADWEGGLSSALERFDEPNLVFKKSDDPSDIEIVQNNTVCLSVSMETLEHIPPEKLEAYLEQIARITDGYFIATVPNEKGPVFLAKLIVKKLVYGGTNKHKLSEVVNATLGRTHKVIRDQHKGFDYSVLIDQIEKNFEVVSIESIPYVWMPLWCSFTIGIVARTRDL